ncbi:MAG: aminotransferase class V-fold PLP-dependent enzyme, partial [Clostridia bacterium]|nr:aminotransferase class V-fold PLP-dependent enzyme [Clostridia bacterium]
FDNCSTTHQKPKSVIRQIIKGATKLNYNPGRSAYKNALKSSLEVLTLREVACEYFNAETPSNVIITKSCTESLNIALRSNIKKNGHIIATIFEHNSVLRTLEFLKHEYNISYSLITPDTNGKINPKDIESNIRKETYLIVTNHVSNVTGTIQNIEEIGKICKKHNLFFVVDGAQSAGHEHIDIKKMNINYLALAGHKGLLGPQGIGLLICNKATPSPLIFGGTGTFSGDLAQPKDLPEGLESGTMSVCNIMGLTAGIKFVKEREEKIRNKIKKITDYIYAEMLKNKQIKLYSPKNSCGVISFSIENMTSNEVTHKLDDFGIATRSGLHCAPKIHEFFNTTNNGLTRIGLSFFNNLRQAKKFIKIINLISNQSN